MTRNSLMAASIAVVIALIGVAAWVAAMLPGDIALPIHWDLQGEPDRFSDKWTALLMPALIAAGTSLLFYFLPELESRERGLQRSRGLYLWGWASILLMCAMIELAVISVALKWTVHGTSFVVAGLGIMFVMIGNQLGKSRSMYLIGFRTPWTLASEEVWVKTHRLAGKLMVVGGLLLLPAALLPLPSGVVATLLGVIIGVAAVVPFVYSYLLWRKERRARAN
jgi:uncharacterized membrane protein